MMEMNLNLYKNINFIFLMEILAIYAKLLIMEKLIIEVMLN